MKGEYSLDVSIPVHEAVKRVMEMPGSHESEGVFFSGRIKQVSKRSHIYFQQVSESEISFSDSLNWRDKTMLLGKCIFKPLGKYNTQITAKFRIGLTQIKIFKAVIWLFLLLIPVASWFLYRLLLDSEMQEDIALKLTILGSIFLIIIAIFMSLILWLNSGKIKTFLAHFSEALGVGNEWV